jgi:hypothetical protein
MYFAGPSNNLPYLLKAWSFELIVPDSALFIERAKEQRQFGLRRTAV